MKHVTITLDDKTADWLNEEAAKLGKTVSDWLNERFEEEMRLSRPSKKTLKEWLATPPWELTGGPLPTREEMYDRPVLRRFEHPDLHARRQESGKTGESD